MNNPKRMLKIWPTIILSFLLAAFFSLMPLPGVFAWLNPKWLVITLLVWAILTPNYVGFLFAWLLGLLLDGLSGTLLGLHALILVILVYILRDWVPQFLKLSTLRQFLWISGLLISYQAVIYWLQGSAGHTANTLLYWLSMFTSPLAWLPIFYIVKLYLSIYYPLKKT